MRAESRMARTGAADVAGDLAATLAKALRAEPGAGGAGAARAGGAGAAAARNASAGDGGGARERPDLETGPGLERAGSQELR
jgi:hypothetical protein